MSTLVCPNCGHVLTVDDEHYSSLLEQVRTAEFQKELDKRLQALQDQQQAEQRVAQLEAEKTFEAKLAEQAHEMARLSERLQKTEREHEQALALALKEKEIELQQLQSRLDQADQLKKTAVLEAEAKVQKQIQAKEQEAKSKELELEKFKAQAVAEAASTKDLHQHEVRILEEQLAFYKDMKAKQSTKMVGETLEQHCYNEFENMRAFRPSISFGKDNDASEGSKGDFILRDYEDGEEYLSIMFEMKNELDGTASKQRHKNEEFFAKLDRDRTKKGCEFAVLVTLLEQDNERYNTGIVDVSHLYPNMFVIRPQFFLPMISLLMKVAKSRLESRRQIAELRRQTIDVTNFEDELEAFRTDFARNYDLASRKFGDAVAEIDKAIRNLEKTKEFLLGSDNNLRIANGKAQKLSIRKLTKNAPSVADEFERVREEKKRASATTVPKNRIEEVKD